MREGIVVEPAKRNHLATIPMDRWTDDHRGGGGNVRVHARVNVCDSNARAYGSFYVRRRGCPIVDEGRLHTARSRAGMGESSETHRGSRGRGGGVGREGRRG